MEINACINCKSNCCKLEIDLTKKEFFNLNKLGLGRNLKKRSIIFTDRYPNYANRISFLDKMYEENHAIILKNPDGFCQLLDMETRLCSIYDNRPEVCKVYEVDGVRCKKIKTCIN
jgi:Fe-S-cluster containining protein